jgi:ATP-dependent exoDNAse (exonuclease V) alpha subunit
MPTPTKFFDIQLKEQQQLAFSKICDFLENDTLNVFILKGYAGTGKTTLIGGVIRYLKAKEKPHRLLATTGRAAKVVSNKTKAQASTIHKAIYTFNGIQGDLDKLSKMPKEENNETQAQLSLFFGLVELESEVETVYIIDESSMISDKETGNNAFTQFGSGNLLKDLHRFDKRGKFIFIGDPCQLPPIGQKSSPALSKENLESNYQLRVDEFELTDIIRQADTSGIVLSSFELRKLIAASTDTEDSGYSKLPLKSFSNMVYYPDTEAMLQHYIETVKKSGFEESTLVCHSNEQCAQFNRKIRQNLFPNSENLNVGDLLMITQNNLKVNLMNGDQVIVSEIGPRQIRAGINFIQVKVRELFGKTEYDVLMIEDILLSNTTNLSKQQQIKLFIDFYERMRNEEIDQRSDKFKERMIDDKYLNALRAVYGYALTCHKTQGGEWNNVFLHMDNKIHGIPRPEIYRWWYTAITRAKENLHVADAWFIN